MVKEDAFVEILDVPISRMGLEQALLFCRQLVTAGQGGYFCFANVHTVTEARIDPKIRGAMTHSTLTFADGIPLSWIARIKGLPIDSRVCGPDFMLEFLVRYPSVRQAFLGGRADLGPLLIKKYKVNATSYSPPMRDFAPGNVEDDLALLREVNADGHLPSVVWVGLGAPKQELWMEYAHRFAPRTLFFGVGAAFDFLGGTKKRAPEWVQRFGLEWLYRLCQEPRRLSGRYLRTNVRFVVEVFCDAARLIEKRRER